MHVPFLDLKAQYSTIKSEIGEAVTRVLDSGQFILGPEVQRFEEGFAHLHSANHAIATNNGTSALHLALWAMGISRDDEVILPVNTFIATAEAVLLCGARPVFVDHDEYYNIDVEQVESRITRRTKAIIAVHLYGQPAKMDALKRITDRHGIAILEDVAQAHLATFEGKSVGAWSHAACFSFYPGKNLGAYGEGGAVITNDSALNHKMRLLRDHGSESKYQHVVAGHNYRLEALQAAILNVKLKYIEAWTASRRRHAEEYNQMLHDCHQIQLPKEYSQAKSVYHLYVIQAADREGLREHLERATIGTGMHYPVPLHQQPCFAYLGYKGGAFPRAEASAKRILSLPMFPELTEAQIKYVAENIRNFYNSKESN
jgi:dTDP-4-amino-4,6-dideoxygalactose transaminase